MSRKGGVIGEIRADGDGDSIGPYGSGFRGGSNHSGNYSGLNGTGFDGDEDEIRGIDNTVRHVECLSADKSILTNKGTLDF